MATGLKGGAYEHPASGCECGGTGACFCRHTLEAEQTEADRLFPSRLHADQPHCPDCGKPGVFWNIATNCCWECEQKLGEVKA